MGPQGLSFLRPAVLMIGVLVLGLGVARSVWAQTPGSPETAREYREIGPVASERYEADSGQQRSSTGRRASNLVLTPGYFEVVCPALCYGGAFHLCGVRAFGGPGYYGPFRRYWGYSTYGPNYNIGPDNSLQFGLQSGVMHVAMRRGKGLYKHGTDRWAYVGAVPPIVGTGGGTSTLPDGKMTQETGSASPSAQGSSYQQTEKGSIPNNTAYLRLLVPENAEVIVEGHRTTSTGEIREFISPPLEPEKNMLYSIVVRYTDVGGKVIEETRSIRVHANDRLYIDCTHPPAVQAEGGPPPSIADQRP